MLDLTSGWTFPALKTSSIIFFAIAYSTATMSNPIVSNVKLSGEYHTSCEGNKVHSPSASRLGPVVPDKFSNHENQANNLHRHLQPYQKFCDLWKAYKRLSNLESLCVLNGAFSPVANATSPFCPTLSTHRNRSPHIHHTRNRHFPRYTFPSFWLAFPLRLLHQFRLH